MKLSRDAMATRFELVVHGSEKARLRAAGEEALEEIVRVERQLNRFSSQSEVSGVNARAAHKAVRVDPRLFSLIQTAQDIYRRTDGAFDITVAPLMRAWKLTEGGTVPDRDILDSARALVGMHHVRMYQESLSVRFDAPGVELDLGGIGKGYSIDRAVDLLRDAGVTVCLLHGGTSAVYACGAPDYNPWRVSIRNPDKEGESLGYLCLKDSALSVSAAHGRSFCRDGQEFGHIIDPRTGMPTQTARLAAVTGPSAMMCDALSTALLVLGTDWLPELANRFSGYGGLVVRAADDKARIAARGIALIEG